jgi:hypothetical protein
MMFRVLILTVFTDSLRTLQHAIEHEFSVARVDQRVTYVDSATQRSVALDSEAAYQHFLAAEGAAATNELGTSVYKLYLN